MDSQLPLEKKNRDKEISIQSQRRELKLLSRIRPQKGHSVFKLKNFQAMIVPEDEWMESEILIGPKGKKYHKKKKIRIDKDATYVSALNLKNAIRKFRKHGYYVKEQ